MLVVRALRGDELVRRRRSRRGVPAEAVVGHRQAAELGDDVVAAGDLRDVALPFLEHRVAPGRVAADTDRGAKVVEHHQGVRHRLRQGEELAVLVVVVPRVVREAARTEPLHTRTERGVLEQSLRRATRDHQTVAGLGPRQRIADPAEEPASGCDVRVEDLVEVRQPEVGLADQSGDQAAAALGRVRDELGLADRREIRRSGGAVGGVALHEHRLLDPVPTPHVGEQGVQLVREHAPARPQMMVRVDDALIGVDDVFDDQRAPRIRTGRGVDHAGDDKRAVGRGAVQPLLSAVGRARRSRLPAPRRITAPSVIGPCARSAS